VELRNYMEDVVKGQLDRVLSKRQDVCKCNKCRLDIIALTLNRFISKYVVTQKGIAYSRLIELEAQLKADVVKEMTKAIAIVKTNPQH